METVWNEKIGLYVDDACKAPKYWMHAVNTFLKHVVTGGYVILMDYFYFQKTKKAHHKTQYNFMQKYKKNFRLVARAKKGSPALFVVLKGLNK